MARAGDALSDVQAVVEVSLAGAPEGAELWHIVLEQGAVEVEQGEAPSPSFTVHAHLLDFLDLTTGRATLRAALTDGRVRISGDVALAVRVGGALFDALQARD